MDIKFLHFITLFVLLQIEFANGIYADTIPNKIDEVIVQASRENFYATSNNTYKLDSFQAHYYGRSSIADILQNFTPTQINSYGIGGISTISLRGTADDQTAVFWNGIKLNSLTLGSADISLIPVNAAKSIQVVTNTSSAVLGSGNFGGAILLNNQPVFRKQFDVSLRQDFSSFKNFRTNFSVDIGNEKLQFSSSSFYQTAKNNFLFVDKYKFDKPTSYVANNEIQQWATVNQLSLKFRKNQQLEFGNYTLQKHHQIPAIMGTYNQSTVFQNDFTTTTFAKYQRIFSNAQYYLRTGYVYEYLLYNDSVNAIISPYYTHIIQNSANYRHYFKHSIVIDAGIDYTINLAKVKQYKNKIVKHQGAIFFGTKYAVKNITFNASVRQEVIKGYYFRPQFGVNISYTDKKQIITTSISYADKFRYPDFNDLYWQPGGNENLKPEYGYGIEYNLSLQPIKKTSKYQLLLSNSTYYTIIKNNIVWSPIASGLYLPQNIKKTRHYGIETKFENTIRWNNTNLFKFTVNYIYNHSSILEDESNASLKNNLIRYKPLHSVKSYLVFEDKYFSLGANILYVGKRFADDENIKVFQLKPYTLVDFFIAYKGYFKQANAEFSFKVNNLFNTEYESLRSYAMPLRNYTISIIFNYKSLPK